METATQTLHRLTSYQPGREWDEAIDDPRIVQDLEANDMSRLPWFVKRYPEPLPRIPLPRELPTTAGSAVAVLAGTAEVKPAPLDLPNLSRLLYLSGAGGSRYCPIRLFKRAEILAMLAAGRVSADIARIFRVHRATASRCRQRHPPQSTAAAAYRSEKADFLIISIGCRA